MSMSANAWSVLAEAIERATPEQCPLLMGQLEQFKASLWLRMTIGTGKPGPSEPDKLLTAVEVAARLGVKTGYVYRNAARYPFMVREGRYIRFSEQGLSKYLVQCQRKR